MKIAPGVLLGYQKRAIKLADENELFVEEKSRRTGLTYAFAPRAVLRATPKLRPRNTYYIGYNKDMAREFIGYCADFTVAFDEAASAASEFLFDDGSEKGVLALRIDFPSGKSIVALSSRPRSLRGMQGDVIIDEAAFHDDLEAVLTAALALTMWGGHVAVISTHNGTENYFNTLIEDIRAKRRDGVVERLTLEDALADGLYQRICLRTGEEWSPEAESEWEAKLRKRYGDGAAEELDVIPARGSGAFLSRATIEGRMSADYPVVRLTPPDGFERQEMEWRTTYVADWLRDVVAPALAAFDPHRRSFYGQDFARSSDLSCVAVGQIDPSTILHCRLGIEMRNVPFRQQKQVLDFVVRGAPMFSAARMDARGNGQQLAESMAEDWGADRIEQAMDTAVTYLQHMPRMKARFDDQTILIPQSDAIVEDLRLIKLVKGVPMVVDRVADKEDGAKGKRHGDFAIALMNLVAAADQDIQPVELFALGQTRAQAGEFVTTTVGWGTIRRRDDFGNRGTF